MSEVNATKDGEIQILSMQATEKFVLASELELSLT